MADLKQIADIQLFALIHEGATTQVYKGYQASLERTVLVKLLKRHLAVELKERFSEEAKHIARIQHPNVVTIFAYGERDGEFYFATEFVEGLSLQEYLDRRPDPEMNAFVLMEICKGLSASHKEGVLHRDIKPSNILISHEGLVKITDFGMARKVSPENQQAPGSEGTLAYFAPEQILNQPLTSATDIFALGVTFYEMLFGMHPFHGNDINELFNSILHDDPFVTKVTAGAQQGLRTICEGMMRKRPTERYQNCDEILQHLGNYLNEQHLLINATALAGFLENPEDYRTARLASTGAIRTRRRPRQGKSLFLIPLSLAVIVAIAFYLNSGKLRNTAREATTRPNFSPGVPQNDNAGLDSISSVETRIDSFFDVSAGEQKIVVADNPEHGPPDANDEERAGINAEDGLKDLILITEPPSAMESTAEPLTAAGHEGSEALSPSRPGFLNVSCMPWATVYIGSDSITTTPLERPLPLAAGSHRLRLINPDFPVSETLVEIEEGDTANVTIKLWESVATLKLEISPWAEVYIDGEYYDTVPPQNHPIVLFPGSHSLELRHPALGSWQTTIDANPGKPIDLKLNLQHLLGN